jgi:hypothetical protein
VAGPLRDLRSGRFSEAETSSHPSDSTFWILADGYEDYERAMAAKLRRELELPLVSGWSLGGEAG